MLESWSDILSASSTALAWMLHAVLLLIMIYSTRRSNTQCRIMCVIYIFYSLPPLLPFQILFFEYDVIHSPSYMLLLPYVITDVFLLWCIYFFYRTSFRSASSVETNNATGNIGLKLLLIIAIVAKLIDSYYNFDRILLPKNEFIATMATESIPNLFLFSIPAESLILGGALFNPFRQKWIRLAVTTIAFFTVLVSFFQGYRHLVFLLALVLFFRWKKTGGVLFVVLMMTFAGELSNIIKDLIPTLLLKSDFNLLSYLESWLENLNSLVGISKEQKAIASNLMLGIEDLSIGKGLLQPIKLFPFTSSIDFSDYGPYRIGEIVGVGYGMGTAYNFQLFMLESLGLSLLFIPFVFFVARYNLCSVLSIYIFECFYSMMRNPPEFWISQLKLLLIFSISVFVINHMVAQISSKKLLSVT